MRKQALCVLFLAQAAALCAQKATEDFEITLPDQKIRESLYNSIVFVDSRYDTSNLGIVQLGMFNKKAMVLPKYPLQNQVYGVLAALNDTNAGHGTLLFQLRQFSFAEVTGAMSEKGYCYLRASLYAFMDNRYKAIHHIDTVILVKSMDVTKSLFRNGSKALTDFIGKAVALSPEGEESYSYDDVLKMDSIEKRKITLYTTTEYKDGLYTSYASFRNQLPDKQGSIDWKNERIFSIKVEDEQGKQMKVKAKNLYAVVYKGQPFIVTEYGYYPARKVGDDFFFTGRAKAEAHTGDLMAASMFFGIMGALIAEDAANATFEMKIDHKNGGFIRLREIKEVSEQKTNP